MKKLIVILFLVFTYNLFAQMPDFSVEVKTEMQKVEVMAGKWEGKGWRQNPNGEKSFSNVSENLYWKLDGTILVMEGVGKTAEGNVVHNAFGVLSYNPFQKKYRMSSQLSNGMSTDANFEVIESNKSFKWWFEAGRGGTIRYTINMDGKNWSEIGDYSRDGNNWSKFFEMNLNKVE